MECVEEQGAKREERKENRKKLRTKQSESGRDGFGVGGKGGGRGR